MELIKIVRRKEEEKKLVVRQRLGREGEEEKERERKGLSAAQGSFAVYVEATAKQIVLIRSGRYLLAGEF